MNLMCVIYLIYIYNKIKFYYNKFKVFSKEDMFRIYCEILIINFFLCDTTMKHWWIYVIYFALFLWCFSFLLEKQFPTNGRNKARGYLFDIEKKNPAEISTKFDFFKYRKVQNTKMRKFALYFKYISLLMVSTKLK